MYCIGINSAGCSCPILWRAHTFNTDMKPNLSYFGPEGWSRPTTNAASWATASHIYTTGTPPHPPPSHLRFILCKRIVFFCRSLWRTCLLYRRVLGRGQYWKEKDKMTSAGQCKMYATEWLKNGLQQTGWFALGQRMDYPRIPPFGSTPDIKEREQW